MTTDGISYLTTLTGRWRARNGERGSASVELRMPMLASAVAGAAPAASNVFLRSSALFVALPSHWPGGTPIVADFNGDGRADIAQYNSRWSTIPICLSLGDGWSCKNLRANYVSGDILRTCSAPS